MPSYNRVLLMGNLTRDPEIRHTPKGTAVGDLAMAINMSYRTADGAEKEEVCYVDVVVWGRQAETCKEYLSKGSPIFVDGRLQLDQWEGSDGEKKSRLRVRAERVQFLSGGSKGSGGGSSGYSRQGSSEKSAPPRHQDHPAPTMEDIEHEPHDDDMPF